MNKKLLAGLAAVLMVASGAAASYQIFSADSQEDLETWVTSASNASISNGSIEFSESSAEVVSQQFVVDTHENLSVTASLPETGSIEAVVSTYVNGSESGNQSFSVSDGSNSFDVSSLSETTTDIEFSGSDLSENASIDSFSYTGTLPQNALSGAAIQSSGFLGGILNWIGNLFSSILGVFGL